MNTWSAIFGPIFQMTFGARASRSKKEKKFSGTVPTESSGPPSPRLNGLLDSMRAEIVPFGSEHFEIALNAFLRYGKGRHPARLNFGDCMSYAVASLAGLPLLYTGTDFTKTDIQTA
jgi:uncharacterized protein with PIN domain